MNILNNIRYIGWLLLENLKHDSIYHRLKEIDKIMKDDIYYNRYIEIQLQKLLSYAVKHIDFYRPYANQSNLSLKDFPVINKNIIMDCPHSFQSDEYEHEKLHVMSTSGSTGRPFKITQNKEKRKQVLAEILYYSGLLGYKPGKKIVYLRNLESGFAKSKFKRFLQNEEIVLTRKYDTITLGNIVFRLSSLGPDTTILGYASTLQSLAIYLRDQNKVLSNISGIISGAEAISSKSRKLVSSQFGCPVVSRYSNQEMGILAQDSIENKFLLNRANYIFELLELDNDAPVTNGRIGRIVVTDLYNQATGLIRYDTGDLGIMKTDKNNHLYLSKVCGRKLDLLYTTNDEPISFFALDDFFENNYDIEQYQIIQETKHDITLNLILKKGKTIDEEYCKQCIKSVLGQNCNVTVCYLTTIPITASGKFKYVICHYHPKI